MSKHFNMQKVQGTFRVQLNQQHLRRMILMTSKTCISTCPAEKQKSGL